MAERKDAAKISREVAAKEKARLLNKNEYGDENGYGPGHPNALATGDEKGKGGSGSNVGSSIDMKQKALHLARNQYSDGKPYTNPDNR